MKSNQNPTCGTGSGRMLPVLSGAQATSRTGSKQTLPVPHMARGFTLIELLLVLVILGVLAAIVVPKFTGRTEDAKKTAARTQISNFKLSLNMFELDVGRFPSGEEGLNALFENTGNIKDWKHQYIDQAIPSDPWGNPYVYKSPGSRNATGYDLYSTGPDGVEGGDDDIWLEEAKK